eukprot:TRINITY_DN39250_c0_g1_i1.p1 TRINITY_DN39250_c0_g1~~TRINITY_DN39250_c0_g1_i1.p1  ORF type:complete len:527 (+),score=102.61 TRINITY_DN39250_c0_g1_i1:62-1582(+)
MAAAARVPQDGAVRVAESGRRHDPEERDHQEVQWQAAEAPTLSKTARSVSALAGCLVPLVSAMSLGFTSPSLETMAGKKLHGEDAPADLRIFEGDGSAASWFSSTINIGALIGAFLGGSMCLLMGKRNVLRLSLVLLGGSWALAAVATDPLWLVALRVPMGLGVGLQSMAAPAFISAMSPPELRGRLGTCNAMAIYLGVMVIQYVGGSVAVFRTGTEAQFCQWRDLSWFIAAAASVTLVCVLFLPETPPYSAGTGHDLEVSPHVGRMLQSRFGGAKLFFAGIIAMSLQQLSGINTVIFFGQSMLEEAGLKNFEVLGVTVTCVQLCGILVAAAVIDHVGRKPLLVVSCGGMGVGALLICLQLQLPTASAMGILFSMYAYVFSFAVGLGPVPWLLLPELGLKKYQRAWLASIATACNWGCSFAVTGPPLMTLEKSVGLGGEFALFGTVCIGGMLLVIFFVPETKRGRRRRVGLERRLSTEFLNVFAPLVRNRRSSSADCSNEAVSATG